MENAILGRDWLTKSCPAQLWAWRRYPGALGFFNLSHLCSCRNDTLVEPLRHDAFQTHAADMREHGRTVVRQMLAVPDGVLGLADQSGNRRMRSISGRPRRSSPSCSIRSKAYNTASLPRRLAEFNCVLWSNVLFIEGMKERIDRHEDGSIKAKGHMMDGELEGYWEWFRLDGSKLRSGHFKNGKQVGEWTTYDATGKVVKVTNFPN